MICISNRVTALKFKALGHHMNLVKKRKRLIENKNAGNYFDSIVGSKCCCQAISHYFS